MTLVGLEPAAPRSRVKHSTTEPLRSPADAEFCENKTFTDVSHEFLMWQIRF